MRIGYGYDVHKLTKDRKLILGGVTIEHELGLLGHSDADVLVHALMDALLGALSLGDIGQLFPDNDEKYKGADSMMLLKKVYEIVKENGYELSNLDSTICAQKPKLMPHILKMRENIAKTLSCDISCVSIKATTTEKLGFEGREEGISATCVCLLKKKAE